MLYLFFLLNLKLGFLNSHCYLGNQMLEVGFTFITVIIKMENVYLLFLLLQQNTLTIELKGGRLYFVSL